MFLQDVTAKKLEDRQKEILVQISAAINGARHLDEVCLRAADKIALLFGLPPHMVAVYLFDPKGSEIRLVAPATLDLDFPHEVVHQEVRAGETSAAVHAAFHRTTIVTDVTGEATVARVLADEMAALKLKTLIVMPLMVQGDLQGVIEVLSIKERDFVEPDTAVLSAVAAELAGGMSRRRLVDELRMKNLELESQTKKTEEVTETLRKFLATFSHELRCPSIRSSDSHG